MEESSRNMLVLVSIAVLASACQAGGGTTDTGTSVISSNEFEIIPNPASSARTVNFNMELENTGDSDAERVVSRLFGPTFGDGARTWKDSTGNSVSIGERTMSFGTLRAAGDNTPAIPKAKSISLTAPSLSQNREVNYNFYSQIFYKYESQASTDFSIVSYDRFQEQDLSRSSASLDSGSGPIQLDIRGTTPKIFYEEDTSSAGEINSQVCIRVINEGEGTPFINADASAPRYYNVQDRDENKVRLNIQDVGNVEFEAQGEQSGNTVTVELVSGTEGFQCYNMEANVDPQTQRQTINTQITANYGYKKENSAEVTVEGRRGTGGGTTQPSSPDSNEDRSGEWRWKDRSDVPQRYLSLYDAVADQDPNGYCSDPTADNRDAFCARR